MQQGAAGKAVYRKDYTTYTWMVEKVRLRVEIGAE